ncbi:MAG: sensor histidine kinase RegB [Paracoccaceae bacterium]
MPDNPLNLLTSESHSNWVRLRVLSNLRWLAIIGQSAALMIAVFQFDLVLNVWACVIAVAASVTINIILTIIYPENKRLSDREAMSMLAFDLVQLVFLIYLTGGLNNPFALLILAPVAISASALGRQSAVFISSAAILLITLVALVHVPLRTLDGGTLAIPDLFVIGFWGALVIGIVFMAGYTRLIAVDINSMSLALIATQIALGRERKLTDLGGVVAATAHELGTPLATIKLVTTELVEELPKQSEFREDIELIRAQADRCRDILRDMGRAGKDDPQLYFAPISAVIREAGEPHEVRGKTVQYDACPKDGASAAQPMIRRLPEVIHGLRVFVQNAVDFAAANVWVDASWNETSIIVTVADDGPGYPPELIGRIGDPFLRRRGARTIDTDRPEYEGMGLGLFIAKTLLERIGAEITFSNGTDPFLRTDEIPERSGAIVEVVWPREVIEEDEARAHGPRGVNPRFLS